MSLRASWRSGSPGSEVLRPVQGEMTRCTSHAHSQRHSAPWGWIWECRDHVCCSDLFPGQQQVTLARKGSALSVLELGRPGFWTTSVASLPLPTLSEQSPSCLHLGTPSTSFWAQVWSQDVRGGRHNLLWVLLAFSAADHSQGQTAWQGPGAAQLGLRERAHPLRGDALWNGPEARTRTRPSRPAVSSREKQLRLGLLHPLTCLCPTCFPPQHPQEGTTA